MSRSLAPLAFLEKGESTPIIDVRSPGEFAHAHIPGAVNIPLFDNNERAQVGTCYKQVGKQAAILLGLELVGPKLADFVRQSQQLAPNNQVLVHCWRGGMRSGSFAWLLSTAGLEVGTLQGGYKAYRGEVLSFFEKPLQLIVLGGKTGSAKTETLQELRKLGEQVIDLEHFACHKGSAFGMLGQTSQPSTEQFENNLYEVLRELDPNRRIWVEDESKAIGTCLIPLSLRQQMVQAPVLVLQVPLKQRIAFLVEHYGRFEHSLLKAALDRIQKRLGGQHHQAAIVALELGDYAQVAEITLRYYDKTYEFSLSQRPSTLQRLVEVPSINTHQNAAMLLQALNTQ
ncbi:MAG: tRNA 2-selenouridine(34) synthase MnmH [Spirosomataceae bacterium]